MQGEEKMKSATSSFDAAGRINILFSLQPSEAGCVCVGLNL